MFRTLIFTCFLAATALAKEGATPAQQAIAAAEKSIAAKPDDPLAYPPLALALAARTRETADPSHCAAGLDAVRKSLELLPANTAAHRAEIHLLLGQHRHSQALQAARTLNKRTPDDPLTYALLTRACIATGQYDEAEKAAQWALDIDPGGAPGFISAARLRRLYGDFPGAIELLRNAFAKTRLDQHGERAELLTAIAALHLLDNHPDQAVSHAQQALEVLPGYPHAIAVLAETATATGDHAASLAHYQKLPPTPHHKFLKARALARTGQPGDFTAFLEQALTLTEQPYNANRELVAYYLDHASPPDPAAALRIARQEFDRRQDIHTRHAFARALHATGDHAAAHAHFEKIATLGTRHPDISYHAGLAARAAGHPDKAKTHFVAALSQAPRSPAGTAALKALSQ